MGLLELSENELFSSKRLDNETHSQYKTRRRIVNLATEAYMKSSLPREQFNRMSYFKAITEALDVQY